ncbi:MAG: calcium-binding protein, partial [Pirellulales bacterium]
NAVNRIVLRGGAGDDRLLNGTGIRSTIYGRDGDDVIIGGQARDSIYAGRGNDFVVGGGGNDYLSGSSGRDQLLGGPGNDSIYGGSGNDILQGEGGRDYLKGGSGNDELFGGASGDRLYGGSGNDRIRGNAGGDRMYGGSGNDRMYGGSGRDYLFGEYGNDRLYGGTGYDYVSGGSGYDYTSWAGSKGRETPRFANAVSASDVARLADAAIDRWEEVGLDTSQLDDVKFRIADLPGTQLGVAVQEADGTRTVWIDADAAGARWFVDRSPVDDSEFTKVTDGALVSEDATILKRADLFTVLQHEIGHMGGLVHTPWLSTMMPALAGGMRLVPDTFLGSIASGKTVRPFVDAMDWSPQNGLSTERRAFQQTMGRMLPQINDPRFANQFYNDLVNRGGFGSFDPRLAAAVTMQLQGQIGQAPFNTILNPRGPVGPGAFQFNPYSYAGQGAFGYGGIANMPAATSEGANMILNDPLIANFPISSQNLTSLTGTTRGVYNAVLDAYVNLNPGPASTSLGFMNFANQTGQGGLFPVPQQGFGQAQVAPIGPNWLNQSVFNPIGTNPNQRFTSNAPYDYSQVGQFRNPYDGMTVNAIFSNGGIGNLGGLGYAI